MPENNNSKKIDGVTLITIICLSASALVITFLVFASIQYKWYGTTILGIGKKQETVRPATQDPFKNIKLEAKAAYVFDGKTGKPLFAKNGTETLPLASLTKIMSAVTALQISKADTKITITPADLGEEGDTGLRAGEIWNLKKLIEFTLLVSSNDGAHALGAVALGSSHTLIEDMNQEAAHESLASMRFYNTTGLDVSSSTAGGYGSAQDVAKLFLKATEDHPDVFGITKYGEETIVSESGISHDIKNTNELVGEIVGLRASKTGYSDLAGGNLVVRFDIEPTHPIIAVVLGSSYDGRFNDMSSLITATYNQFREQTF